MQAVGKRWLSAGDYRSYALVMPRETRAALYYFSHDGKMICCSLVKRESDSWICCEYLAERSYTSPRVVSSRDLTDLFLDPGRGFLSQRYVPRIIRRAKGAFAKNFTNMIRDESWWIVIHCFTDMFSQRTRHVQRPGLADRELA